MSGRPTVSLPTCAVRFSISACSSSTCKVGQVRYACHTCMVQMSYRYGEVNNRIISNTKLLFKQRNLIVTLIILFRPCVSLVSHHVFKPYVSLTSHHVFKPCVSLASHHVFKPHVSLASHHVFRPCVSLASHHVFRPCVSLASHHAS